jgi:hypothetical protein
MCGKIQRRTMKNLSDLSREELLLLLDVYAKNWLAHDGSWFLQMLL